MLNGDFDWPGLQIANQVMRLCGARPWRFTSEDYEQSVSVAPHTERDLGKASVTASWDARLADAMGLHGLAIAEEAVASLLLSDLAVSASEG